MLIFFSHPNYSQFSGKRPVEYEEDGVKRARKKYNRKPGLIKAAYEFATITGGTVFVKYVGPPDNQSGKVDAWSYATKDSLYNEYLRTGLHPEIREKREHNDSSTIFIPRPLIPTSTPNTSIACAIVPNTSTPVASSSIPDVSGVQVRLNKNSFVTPSKSIEAQEVDLNFLNVHNSPNEITVSSTIDMDQFHSFAVPLDHGIPQSTSANPEPILSTESEQIATLDGNGGMEHRVMQGINEEVPVQAEEQIVMLELDPDPTQVCTLPTEGPITGTELQVPTSISQSGAASGSQNGVGSLHTDGPIVDQSPQVPTSVPQSGGTVSMQDLTSVHNNTVRPKTGVTIAGYQKEANTLMVKKLIADKIKTKLKSEDKVKHKSEVVKENICCISCGEKWYKSHQKWRWQTCGLCGLKAHTLCLGWSREEAKKRLFTCSNCDTTDN